MSTAVTVKRVFLALMVVFGLLACVAHLEHGDLPPQGWWKERGPVVPHDTFPADCKLCHVGDDWQTIREDFTFDHAAETGVALLGAHTQAQCLRCHNDRGPIGMFVARGCAGCHEDVHRAQLGSDCATCHGQTDWRPSEQIALHNRTRFPLVGAHAAAACFRCHIGAQIGNFSGVDTRCESCHQDDLAQATDPDHLAQGWTSNCDDCHIPTTWTGGGFNHGVWPLTGQHKSADCTLCHPNNMFTGARTDCFSCHMSEYTGATDPNHVALNFSTNCEQCHNTTNWNNANFSHAGITSGCVTCHLNDYNNTSDPNHMAVGFPTTCESCHNTNGWGGANFNHSFPINSGPHSNLQCADCHLAPRNYMLFSCTHCHEHSFSETSDEHDDVRNFVWESNACLACHPNGQD